MNRKTIELDDIQIVIQGGLSHCIAQVKGHEESTHSFLLCGEVFDDNTKQSSAISMEIALDERCAWLVSSIADWIITEVAQINDAADNPYPWLRYSWNSMKITSINPR